MWKPAHTSPPRAVGQDRSLFSATSTSGQNFPLSSPAPRGNDPSRARNFCGMGCTKPRSPAEAQLEAGKGNGKCLLTLLTHCMRTGEQWGGSQHGHRWGASIDTLSTAPQAAEGSGPKPPPSLTFLPPVHSREEKQPPESQDLGKRSRRDSQGHPELSHSQ